MPSVTCTKCKSNQAISTEGAENIGPSVADEDIVGATDSWIASMKFKCSDSRCGYEFMGRHFRPGSILAPDYWVLHQWAGNQIVEREWAPWALQKLLPSFIIALGFVCIVLKTNK